MEGAAEDTLSTHFRQAALSITQLYKETTKASRRAYAQGYASCLQDLWLLLSTADNSATIHSHHHNQQRVLTLDDLAAFARSKQDVLDQSGLAFGGYNSTNATENASTVTAPMNQSSLSPSPDYSATSAQPRIVSDSSTVNTNTNTAMRRDRSSIPRGETGPTTDSSPVRSAQLPVIPHLQSNVTAVPTLPTFTFQIPSPSSDPSFFPSYHHHTQHAMPFSFKETDNNDTYTPTSDGSLKRRRNNNQNDDMMYNFFGASFPSAFMNSENPHPPPSSKKGRWRKSDDRMMSD